LSESKKGDAMQKSNVSYNAIKKNSRLGDFFLTEKVEEDADEPTEEYYY